MSEMTPLETAAAEMLEWLEVQQRLGSVSLSVVARLATLLESDKEFDYRESDLTVSRGSANGVIRILTKQRIYVATLTQAEDTERGRVEINVLSRKALRSIHIEGGEAFSDMPWSDDSRDSLPRPQQLTLTYDNGSPEGYEVLLDVKERGRMRGKEGEEAQRKLIASLLEDLTS